jgi:glutamate-1-semialdehyde 2,1-aminomutase
MRQPSPSRTPEEIALLEAAARALPGGVLGSARFPDDVAFIVTAGRGSRLYDASGREYIDYLLGSGPLVLGHSPPAVVAAVREQLERGTTYFLVNAPIVRLAEEVCRAVPCAEQVRFTSSGSEATFFALRAARAFRRRDKILKFEGGYHGSHDYALMSSAPRSPKAFPAATADSAGIPHAIEGEVLIAPYNDLATVEALLAAHGDALGAVIVEPFQRLIPPAPGFLQGLCELTRRREIPLVFDEVVTGFRFAYGGAQEFYGVVPDLAACGKILGGGFPLAAVCGRADIMRAFDPRLDGSDEFVSQIGTLNGNPIAAVAGLATLAELRKPGAFERLHATGRTLKEGLAALVRASGLPAQVVGESTVFDIVFTDRPVTDYRAVLAADGGLLRAFNAECLKRGVCKGREKLYVSLAHSDEDIARTLEAFEGALRALPRGPDGRRRSPGGSASISAGRSPTSCWWTRPPAVSSWSRCRPRRATWRAACWTCWRERPGPTGSGPTGCRSSPTPRPSSPTRCSPGRVRAPRSSPPRAAGTCWSSGARRARASTTSSRTARRSSCRGTSGSRCASGSTPRGRSCCRSTSRTWTRRRR